MLCTYNCPVPLADVPSLSLSCMLSKLHSNDIPGLCGLQIEAFPSPSLPYPLLVKPQTQWEGVGKCDEIASPPPHAPDYLTPRGKKKVKCSPFTLPSPPLHSMYLLVGQSVLTYGSYMYIGYLHGDE